MMPYLLLWAHGAFTTAMVIFFVLYVSRPGTVSELHKKIRKLQTQLDNTNAIIKRMDDCTDRLGAKSCINPPEDLERAVEAAVKERAQLKQRIAEHEVEESSLCSTLWCVGRKHENHTAVIDEKISAKFDQRYAVLTTLRNPDGTIAIRADLDEGEKW
jgi:hypothetical protein